MDIELRVKKIGITFLFCYGDSVALYNAPLMIYQKLSRCPGGEIGRHNGLKIRRC